MKRKRLGLAIGIAFSALACEGGRETGTVVFSTWGEEFIEQGLSKDVFRKDNWSVKYTRFLLAIRQIEVADENRQIGAALAPPQVFDMTKPGEKEIARFTLEAKQWPYVSYQIGPITEDAVAGQLTGEDDLAELQRDGASIHVEGIATGPKGETKTFNWTFERPTKFEDCRGEQDGKTVDGLLVTNGGTERVQITIHGDHLFYDDLQAPEAVPRFQAFANADANDDGKITLQELDAVPLYTISADLGSYGTGALGNVNTLGDYARLLAQNFGHYRGEGSCNAKDVK